MKHIVLIASLIISANLCLAQNLVPNGDFEQYYGCPYATGHLDSVKLWQTPTYGSPDYFHSCGTSFANVPYAAFNYQNAKGGSAFAGIIIYHQTVFEYREYISIKLIQPLMKHACYLFEMYVNLVNDCLYTSEDLGVYFSDTLGTQNTTLNLPFVPQIINLNGNITDTMGWTLISGYYQANGGEEYLTIGNFLKDTLTKKTPLNRPGSNNNSVYLHVDDVSLTNTVSTNCFPTGVSNLNQIDCKLYPNPFINYLAVKINSEQPHLIFIYDVLGNKLREEKIESTTRINTKSLPEGFYFYRITNDSHIVKKGTLIKK